MPTGYTEKLCREDVSFSEFALTCARAFGACIDMKEDSMEKDIPDAFEPSTYHSESVARAKAELQGIYNMTNDSADAKAEAEYVNEKDSYQEYIAKANSVRERIHAMLVKVNSWAPPTADHSEMASFMVEQLESTLRFDGNPEYYESSLAKLTKQSGSEWRKAKIESLKGLIKYHEKEHAEEVERTKSRNKWLADLRQSLTN